MKSLIYTRVSSVGERQNVERQINDLKAYANKNNIEVIATYQEKISGAVSNDKRDVLNECLQYAKNESVDVILFSELSRLGRNVLEIMEKIKWLQDNKINAFFQKENMMLLNDNGEVSPTTTILISCLGMVAQLERDNIKFRLNSGRECAKNKGVKMGRPTNTKMTSTQRQQKYSKVIKMLNKGLTVKEVLTICKAENIKVGEATIWNLKKEFCSKNTRE